MSDVPSSDQSTDPTKHLFPQEPARFNMEAFEALLAHATRINASDVTLQTNEEVF